MTYYKHLIDKFTSNFWSIGDEQQELLGAEIESAAATIRLWRTREHSWGIRSSPEETARERGCIAKMVERHPLTIAIFNDCESSGDKAQIKERIKEALDSLGNPKVVHIGQLSIWTFLAITGEDKFTGPIDAFDRKPSEVIKGIVERGDSFDYVGTAKTASGVMNILRKQEYFSQDDED